MTTLNMHQVKPFVVADIKAGICPLLLGDAGIGKSSMVEALSEDFDTKVFTIPINQMADRADVTGARLIQDEKTLRWRQAFFPHATIDEAITYAKNHPNETPILFMDEINRATSDITSTVLAFITTRRIGTEDFPANLRFVTAGNDKGNIVSLDDASLTRFSIYHLKPDANTFLSVQALNKFVEQAVKEHPDYIQAPVLSDETVDDEHEEDSFIDMLEAEESSFTQLTTPRTITYLSDFLNALKITGSGSDDEKSVMSEMITDTTDDEKCLLLASMEAHVGHTALCQAVFDKVFDYFQQLNAGVLGNQSQNNFNWSPSVAVTKSLHEAQSTSDAEMVIMSMDAQEKENFLLWIISGNGRQTVDNNSAMESAAKAVVADADDFSKDFKKTYAQILLSGAYDKHIVEEIKEADSFASLVDITNQLID